jgi:hypothetical protein
MPSSISRKYLRDKIIVCVLPLFLAFRASRCSELCPRGLQRILGRQSSQSLVMLCCPNYVNCSLETTVSWCQRAVHCWCVCHPSVCTFTHARTHTHMHTHTHTHTRVIFGYAAPLLWFVGRVVAGWSHEQLAILFQRQLGSRLQQAWLLPVALTAAIVVIDVAIPWWGTPTSVSDVHDVRVCECALHAGRYTFAVAKRSRM